MKRMLTGTAPPRTRFAAALAVMIAATPLSAAIAADTVAMPHGDMHEQLVISSSTEPVHYRLYVPVHYNPARSYPLVVVLHGSGADENSPFDHSDVAKLAEQRGYILLAPFGSARGGYGNFYPVVVTHQTAQSLPKPGTPFDRSRMPHPANVAVSPEDFVDQSAAELQPDFRVSENSERETLDVLAHVRSQYHIDPARIYLMGNSMGGLGTTYLAAKYPQIWAAISPQGGPVAAWSYPFERLRRHHVAALFVHGEFDEHASPHWSELLVKSARAEGVDADFLLVPGGHHGDAWTMVLPQIFDFFDRHIKPLHAESATGADSQ